MPPIDKKSLSKDQKKALKVVEDMPIPEDRFNPIEDLDQAPISEDQKEKLSAWNIDLPRSARAAESLIGFIEAASGMKGTHADMQEKRIVQLRRYQTTYPRGTLLQANYRMEREGKPLWITGYGKVIDWYARGFESRAAVHHRLQEDLDIKLNRPVAPFQLIVLFPGGNIERVSQSNINKIKDIPEDIPSAGTSPEGSRKLR